MSHINHHALWESINKTRMELAELKGMLTMHFRDGTHHHPPCKTVASLQKMLISTLFAAVCALLATLANIMLAMLA